MPDVEMISVSVCESSKVYIPDVVTEAETNNQPDESKIDFPATVCSLVLNEHIL